MSTSGPQDSPVWPPVPAGQSAPPGPQDRRDPPATATPTPAPASVPPSAYPPNERRPRHPRRIAFAAAGALVLVGAGTAAGLTGPRTEQTVTLPHAITALNVTAGAGDITVRAGGRPGQVEVTRKTRATSLPALTPDDWQGDTLSLDCGVDCNVTYEIRVPNDVAVTARTESGDVDLAGAMKTVALQTGSGDVDARVNADTLNATSTSGEMNVRLGAAPSRLTATSESGDIEIRVPKGQPYAVDAQTTSGDSDIDVTDQPSADHRIQVRTVSGDIEVRSR